MRDLSSLLTTALLMGAALSLVSADIHAQPDSISRVTIQAPEELAQARVQVTIGQTNAPVYLDSTAAVQITVPAGHSGGSYLQVRYAMRRTSGHWASLLWQDSVELVPDSVVVVTLEDDVQPGEVGQFETSEWPVVTWSATEGALDAYLNGRSRGTTDQTRAVRPGRRHRLEWKSGSTVVCAVHVSLDRGQRRKFSCDRATRQVSEH